MPSASNQAGTAASVVLAILGLFFFTKKVTQSASRKRWHWPYLVASFCCLLYISFNMIVLIAYTVLNRVALDTYRVHTWYTAVQLVAHGMIHERRTDYEYDVLSLSVCSLYPVHA